MSSNTTSTTTSSSTGWTLSTRPDDAWEVRSLTEEPDCRVVKVYAKKHDRVYTLAYPKQYSPEEMADQIRSVFK